MMEWILSSMDDGSSDTRKLVGMTAMHAITRKFEFKREMEREEVLNPCVERAFPKMLIMLRGCLERMMQSQEREDIVVEQMVGEYAKAIIKTFWSATYLDIPKAMRQQHAGEGGQPFEALRRLGSDFLANFGLQDAVENDQHARCVESDRMRRDGGRVRI